jgi:hypothetical protein
VSESGKILSLSYRNIAAILTGAAALLSFGALVWISEGSDLEPTPPNRQTQRSNSDAPVMPATQLPSSGLDGLGTLPPRR